MSEWSKLANGRSGIRSCDHCIYRLMPCVVTECSALDLATRTHIMPDGKFLVPSALQNRIATAPDESGSRLQRIDCRLIRRRSLCAQAVSIGIRLNQKSG